MLAPEPRRAGARVRLSFCRAEDRDEFIALARASRRFHRGRVAPPISTAAFDRLVSRCGAPEFASLLVRRCVDGVLLGAIEISEIVWGIFRSGYMGYWVGAPFAGEGYMTEAVALALDFAFRQLRLHRLEANIQPGNAASLALVRRLGFTREGYSRRYLKIAGRWRDHERWAMFAENWRARSGGHTLREQSRSAPATASRRRAR